MKRMILLTVTMVATHVHAMTHEARFAQSIKGLLDKYEDTLHELSQTHKELKNLKGKPRETIAPALITKATLRHTKDAYKVAVKTLRSLSKKGTAGLPVAYKTINRSIERYNKNLNNMQDKITLVEKKVRKQGDMSFVCSIRELEAQREGTHTAIETLQKLRANIQNAENVAQ